MLAILATSLLTAACDITITIDGDSSGDAIRGSAHLVTQTYDVSTFTQVDVSSALSARIETGVSQSVQAHFDDNLIDTLEVDVRDDTLYLTCDRCDPSDDAVITIGVSSLTRLAAGGASHVRSGAIKSDAFAIALSGASRAELDGVEVEALSLDLSGASRAIIDDGSVSEMTARASGASSIAASSLEVESLDMHLSGASRAEVAVTQEVSGSLSGASMLQLTGDFNPVEDLDVTGASRVER
jgi:hypothetical protein